MVSVLDGTCIRYSEPFVFIVTGIEGIDDELEISIYPNPVQGTRSFSLKGKELSSVSEIMVLSTTGEVISNCDYQVLNNTKIEFTLSGHFSTGLYYLYIQHQDKTVVKKFILNE